MISLLAFVLPLALYVSLPSCAWNFDGVACAAALELGQPTYFFHANHLLYGFFGFLFWKGIGSPLGLVRALPALQLFTSLLSALGLIGLYRVFALFIKDKWISLGLTLSLAVSAAFWIWSVEAQVYPLAFLPLAWATVRLFEPVTQRKYILVGLLHGAAILGHVLHVLWMIPVLYWILNESRELEFSPARSLRHYLSALSLTTLIPYAVVLISVVMPGRDAHRVWIWLKGSAGLTPDRHFAWHSIGWSGPWIWLKSTAPTMWGSFLPVRAPVSAMGWSLTALSVLLFVFLFSRICLQPSGKLWKFCLLWIGVYGLFLSTWEPATLCYRMTDVLPIGILLALGLRTLKSPIQAAIVSALLASTLTLNLVTTIAPMHRSTNNSLYQETLTLSKMTSEESLYLTGGGLPWIYLLYFTGRTAWNVGAFTPAQLLPILAEQRTQHPVYLLASLLSDATMGEPLRTLKPKQIKEGSPWLQLP